MPLLLVSLPYILSQDGSVPPWILCSRERQPRLLDTIKTLCSDFEGRGISQSIETLIVASFNPNNVLQRVVRGLIDWTT